MVNKACDYRSANNSSFAALIGLTGAGALDAPLLLLSPGLFRQLQALMTRLSDDVSPMAEEADILYDVLHQGWGG